MRSLVAIALAGGLVACGGGDADDDAPPGNRAPLVNAGADLGVVVDDPAMLAATATDRDDDPLTTTWTVMSAPDGSVAQPADPSALATTFTPDVVGTYTLLITASDGMADDTDTMTVVARERGVAPLEHDVVDAEYSRTLGRIIMLSEPRALYIHDPETGDEVEITLPLPGFAVSVSPDGTEAVVGHDGYMSWVQLETPYEVVTYPMSTVAVDIVHGGNGWAYVIPLFDQAEEVRCIELATGMETLGSGLISAGSRARKHPTRTVMYLANRGVNPDDIELHDLSLGPSELLYDSPYHGDFDMCGDLWFTASGDRIFTACGNIFRSSPDRELDMTYNGSLSEAERVQFVDHNATAGLVAVVPANDFDTTNRDVEVQLYDDDFIGHQLTVPFPPMTVGTIDTTSHGRFVFWNASGTRLYAIVRGIAGGSHDGVWATDKPVAP
jgi:hypothetical protein